MIVFGSGHITDKVRHFIAPDFSASSSQLLLVEVNQQHICAFSHKPFTHSFANATGTTGNNGNLAF
jgi:hypothetical protein